MRLLNTNRRKIAAVMAIVFAFWIHSAAWPRAAHAALPSAGRPAAVSATEMDPGLVEQRAEEASPSAKKKSPVLPVIIGLAAAATVAAVLFFFVLKTKYDVVGLWRVTTQIPGGEPVTGDYYFRGDPKSGKVLTISYGVETLWGTYEVDGKKVHVALALKTLEGRFTARDRMEGTMTGAADLSGTWSAVRKSALP